MIILPQTESVQQGQTQKENIIITGIFEIRQITCFNCEIITNQLTFPMARRALSKNSIIPKKRKNTPNPVSPMPISVVFEDQNKLYFNYLEIIVSF